MKETTKNIMIYGTLVIFGLLYRGCENQEKGNEIHRIERLEEQIEKDKRTRG